jgi:hypothetical protein
MKPGSESRQVTIGDAIQPLEQFQAREDRVVRGPIEPLERVRIAAPGEYVE